MMDEYTMAQARRRVAQEWHTPQEQGEYIKKNVEVVLGYGKFNKGQDGYEALAMLLAFAEKLGKQGHCVQVEDPGCQATQAEMLAWVKGIQDSRESGVQGCR